MSIVMNDYRILFKTGCTKSACWSTQCYVYNSRLRDVITLANRIFGSDDGSSWPFRPARALGGNKPCSLLTNEQGFCHVIMYLGRVELGVYT
ncbi:antitoxin Xre/MbcA/ParS toxin-binding domain-containing protein [Pseudomonas shirazensis]|uniref:antitoxin Xre/MbcA/ParS toxin-binding domain-containing protein n=1 Tax=Pseudomonas shirazensis TaxID=2745494 RepID=UPI003CFF44E0